MVRVEILMTEEQARRLKARARREGLSVSALVRRETDRTDGASARGNGEDAQARALAVVGRYHGGAADVAENHDTYFAEAILS